MNMANANGKVLLMLLIIVLTCGRLYASDGIMVGVTKTVDFLSSLEGVFSLSATVVGLVVWLVRRKVVKKIWYAVVDFFHGKYSVQDLAERKLVLRDELLSELRTRVRILVIDDNTIARDGMVNQLKGLGYLKAKGLYPVTRNDDNVKESQILVIDINNVYFGYQKPFGTENQGLDVASAIKSEFPVKKVLVYTGNLDDYKGNVVLEKVVDGKFEKGDEQSIIVKRIDWCIRSLFEPDKFWIQIRDELLQNGETISQVANLEDIFVREFIRENILSLDIIKRALDRISSKSSLADAMVKVVAAIK